MKRDVVVKFFKFLEKKERKNLPYVLEILEQMGPGKKYENFQLEEGSVDFDRSFPPSGPVLIIGDVHIWDDEGFTEDIVVFDGPVYVTDCTKISKGFVAGGVTYFSECTIESIGTGVSLGETTFRGCNFPGIPGTPTEKSVREFLRKNKVELRGDIHIIKEGDYTPGDFS